jgi:hypothetical protein
LQAIEYQDLIYGGRKWRKVGGNGMFYPLGTMGEFEPLINSSTYFSKNLEMSAKMTIAPPAKRPRVVNSNLFCKKVPPGG